MIKDFSCWIEYKGFSEGSGRSEKVWLTNSDNTETVLFKFNKAETTTEHISEAIASDIASVLGISSAKVEIGTYNKRIGCASYLINENGEDLIEGVRLINKFYPYYDQEILYDSENEMYYSLEMILEALSLYEFKNEFFKIMIFDFIIGNTDRHQNNWAILSKNGINRLCPVYDNGSSLCSYIKDDDVNNYLGKDRVRFRALVNSKSKSRIKIDCKKSKEPTHLEVFSYIYSKFHDEVHEFVDKTIEILTNSKIDEILNRYNNSELVSDKKRLLISLFLKHKINLLKYEVDSWKEE